MRRKNSDPPVERFILPNLASTSRDYRKAYDKWRKFLGPQSDTNVLLHLSYSEHTESPGDQLARNNACKDEALKRMGAAQQIKDTLQQLLSTLA